MQRACYKPLLRRINLNKTAWRNAHTATAPLPRPSYNVSRVGLGTALASGTLALLAFRKPALGCDATPPTIAATDRPVSPSPTSPPDAYQPTSIYTLGFGTVAGICAGVFVAKGLKAVAFVLGGLFVFLQYTSSKSLTTVNWGAMGRRYNTAVETLAGGDKSQPAATRIYRRFTDFLLANFPERATFLCGFALGIRLG